MSTLTNKKKSVRTAFAKSRLLGSAALLLGAALHLSAAPFEVVVDSKSNGRIFEGLGALSAGASSRLLMEYPEPQRSQILDFLFLPSFGASLQHLKVEVGGDVNSTDGTEPSHARTRDEFQQPNKECFERGYEWWLMVEAKKRNPRIFLDMLQWGAPGWIGENEHADPDRTTMTWEQVQHQNRLKFYTQDNIDFLVSFIQGAKRYYDLDIDFCGIWNETAYDIPWTKSLHHTLDARSLGSVKIVAADHTGPHPWEPAKDILKDPELRDAVYAIGAHYPSMSPPKERKAYDSIPEAKQTGKPLWASEDGPWRGDWTGAAQLARIYNRNYIVGKMTKTIIWSLVTSYYENLPIPNSGPLKANSPWSGAYEVQPATWAIAHTTQFARPGWRYLDSGCGFLPDDTGSYVTLCAPDHPGDYSIIIETTDAKTSQSIFIRAPEQSAHRPLSVWCSTTNVQFMRLGDLVWENGGYLLDVQPRAIYSLTTTRGQRKGETLTKVDKKSFPFPYQELFEAYPPGRYARYFSDQGGVFEVARRLDGKGQCLRQTVLRRGIDWNGHPNPEPYTVLGSTRWSNYEVACDVLLENRGYVALFGRVGHCPQQNLPPHGYCARITADGVWELLAQTNRLATGSVSFRSNDWHRLALRFASSNITFAVDEREVVTIQNLSYASGMAGVGSGFNAAQFDNFEIRRIAETSVVELDAPNLAAGKTVRASSCWGEGYSPANACDGDEGTRWNAAKGDLAGAWLEVDFGKPTRFDTVLVSEFLPRIRRYKLQVPDAGHWRTIQADETHGGPSWRCSFPSVTASSVRLFVMSTHLTDFEQGTPSLFELQVFDTASIK